MNEPHSKCQLCRRSDHYYWRNMKHCKLIHAYWTIFSEYPDAWILKISTDIYCKSDVNENQGSYVAQHMNLIIRKRFKLLESSYSPVSNNYCVTKGSLQKKYSLFNFDKQIMTKVHASWLKHRGKSVFLSGVFITRYNRTE